MNPQNKINQFFIKLITDFSKHWNDESGYYYVEFKEDKQGNKQIKIEAGIVYSLIACITILFLTVLVLAYHSKAFPLAVVFLIATSFLAFLTVMVLAIRSKWGIAVQIALVVMLVLCLGILGFHMRDIIDVIRVLPIK